MATPESVTDDTALVGRSIPLHWKASVHKQTGKAVFPEIPHSSPSAPLYETIELSNTAELYSFTIIHPSPKSGKPPFVLVYADFPEKVRVFGPLALEGTVRPRIGMRLRAVSTGAVAGAAGYQFVSDEEQGA